MAYENLCMYCFKEMDGKTVCPHCGKDSRAAVPQIQMLPGTLVYHDRFLIGRALGQDASGVVYNALDTKRGGTIRIREYLPRNCAERLNDGGVVPLAGMEDAFETGMNKLRASVESVEDPKKRHFFFEENGTAYIAQRKNAAAAPAYAQEDDEDDEYESGRKRLLLYIGIGAAVVLLIIIGLIWFLNSMSDSEDMTLNQPIATPEVQATWMPEITPTPTPYATATFAALVDPELSWMDYTYNGNVNNDYEEQVSSTATRKPTILDDDNTSSSSNYSTISGKSSAEEIKNLQKYLVQLGWLDYSNINGKYDSATKQAVKDFQQYVNEHCSPATKLSVDGIAGKNTLKWLLNSSVSITKPTPTPQPLVTPDPNEIRVDKNSDRVDIIAVQNKLIALGVMKPGSADGVYGSDTVKAVKSFQNRVNQILGYKALSVSGVMDEASMAYLNYYVNLWEELHQATATPVPAVTPTPSPAPTSQIINSNSPREQITAVQEMLEKVGLFTTRQIDGNYGKETIAAMKAFQTWVNQVKGVETLAVTGECDPLTRAYLEYAVQKGMKVQGATPTATPEIVLPTDDPEEDESSNLYVDKDSPKESIAFVQEMLYSMGLLTQDDIDGDYGERTAAAVAQFQQYVNEQLGEGRLKVNGYRCDDSTLGYMEYYYEDGIVIRPTEAPTAEPTEEPTVEPTLEPTVEPTPEPTEEPTIEPTEEPTEEPTQAPIPELSGFDVRISGGEAVDGIVRLDEGKYLIDWAAESGAKAYSIYLYDGSGKLINKMENTGSTQLGLDTATMRKNEVYTLRVAALPEGGDKDDVVWKELRLSLKDSEPEQLPELDPTDAPTEIPTEEPTAEPTEEPTPEPVEPEPIEGLFIGVDGAESENGVTLLESGDYSIRWGAESGVESYYIYLYDGNGQLMNKAEGVGNTHLDVSASNLIAGAVYTLKVGAMPVNGTKDDIQWTEIQLMRPIPPTAKPTEEPTPTPEPTASPTPRPSVGKPVISIGSSVYQKDGVTYISGSTIIFNWMAEGQVGAYNVSLLYEDGTSYDLGSVQSTSKTLSADQLAPGRYKLFVGAIPEGLGDEDAVWSEYHFVIPQPEPDPTEVPTPEPTEEPSIAPEETVLEYLDVNSSQSDIQKAQMALYTFGLLNEDNVTPGVLDVGTLKAFAQFQTMVNEQYGAGLYVIDPELDTSIDAQTLYYLLYAEIELNPIQ